MKAEVEDRDARAKAPATTTLQQEMTVILTSAFCNLQSALVLF